jgi:MFS family permease
MPSQAGENTPQPEPGKLDDRAAGPRPLGAILLTLFLDLVCFSIIFPLFPAILDSYPDDALLNGLLSFLQSLSPDIGLDDPRLITLFGGVLGSLYSLLQFLLSPFWGSLSDRIGRRPVLLLTIGLNLLAALLWAFSGTFFLLVLSRLLAGAAGGNIATATAAVADVTPGKDRARGMGLVGAAFGLGFILGPAIGGYLSIFDLSDRGELPFLSGLAFTPFTVAALGVVFLHLINLLWILKALPETRPESTETRPLQWSVSLGGRWGETIRNTNLANLVYLLAFSGMEFTLAFLVRQRLDFGTTETATMFVVIGLILALVQGGLTRRLAHSWGPEKTAIRGMILVSFGLVGIALTSEDWHLWAALIPLSAGSAMAMPMLSTIVSSGVPAEEQGAALGVFRSLGSLSRAIGPFAAAILYWQMGSAAPYFVAALLLVIPMLLLSGGLARKDRIS